MDKSKRDKFIYVMLCVFVVVVLYTAYTDQKRQEDIETYNIGARKVTNSVYSFCDNALGIYDEEPTSFSELNDSHAIALVFIRRWVDMVMDAENNGVILYKDNGENAISELVSIFEDISELNSDIMNAYFLKNPEKNVELTKEEVTKRVKDIRQRTDMLCGPFPE